MAFGSQGIALPKNSAAQLWVLESELSGALLRLVEHAPYKPFCSNNKTASSVLPFSIARTKEYIQINQPTQVYWLIFDLDHSNPFIWDDVGLPPPNIVTVCRETQRSHISYAIHPVCVSENGSQKAVAYMKAVRKAYSKALKADPDYCSPVTKNPLHPRWHVFSPTNHVYWLDELADYNAVDLSYAETRFNKSEKLNGLEDPSGRNCTLFLQLRTWAYQEVNDARESGSFDAWFDRVLNKAELLNSSIGRSFKNGPLRFSEIKATAKSVSRWTWSKYTGSSVNRGVMGMSGTDIPLGSRQRLAARRTHQVRKNSTSERILKATKVLLAANACITRTELAKACKLTRQTVSKYWELVEETISKWDIDTHTSDLKAKIEAYFSNLVERGIFGYAISSVTKNTGISRRKVKQLYPALFDP